jgi:hypothetical protein
MYHASKQTRSWQVRFILDLVYAFVRSKAWDPATVIVIHKGKTGAPNMAEMCKAIFEEGKIFDLAGKKVTSGEIIAKAEAWDAKNAKAKLPVVLEGRHRVVALWLVAEFFNIRIEAAEAEVGDDMAQRIALEANLTNESYAKLLNTEKLQGIVDAIKAGVYKKQTDLPVKRGQQQKLWHAAQAVIVQGIDLEKAAKLTYKEAAQVVEGKAKVDDLLAARAGNAAKVLPGEKIRELATMVKNYDPESKSVLAKLINAIVDNAETTAKTIIVDAFKK